MPPFLHEVRNNLIYIYKLPVGSLKIISIPNVHLQCEKIIHILVNSYIVVIVAFLSSNLMSRVTKIFLWILLNIKPY